LLTGSFFISDYLAQVITDTVSPDLRNKVVRADDCEMASVIGAVVAGLEQFLERTRPPKIEMEPKFGNSMPKVGLVRQALEHLSSNLTNLQNFTLCR